MTFYQIIHEVRKHGWLLLMKNGRLHVELPTGHEELLSELKTHKERVRAILVARLDAKEKRKVKRPAPLSSVPKPVFIPIMCTCRKYPYAHIHGPINLNDPDDVVVVTPLSGSAVWSHLKKQTAIAREKAKNPVFDNYAFELTQAVPPIVLRSEDTHCDRPMESIKPGESIEIMIGREMTPPKESKLSPWGKFKIRGYGKYRWDAAPKLLPEPPPWFLPIGVHVTAVENGQVTGRIEWCTRATDYEYVRGRRIEFQERSSKERLQ